MEEIWNVVQDSLLSSIKCMQWTKQDKFIPREEFRVAENWGLNNPIIESLSVHDKRCIPSIPFSWADPPPDVFKLNFDGASRRNPGQARFGGLVRDH